MYSEVNGSSVAVHYGVTYALVRFTFICLVSIRIQLNAT